MRNSDRIEQRSDLQQQDDLNFEYARMVLGLADSAYNRLLLSKPTFEETLRKIRVGDLNLRRLKDDLARDKIPHSIAFNQKQEHLQAQQEAQSAELRLVHAQQRLEFLSAERGAITQARNDLEYREIAHKLEESRQVVSEAEKLCLQKLRL